MRKYPKVSIIIPLYVISERFFQDLQRYKKLDYPAYEILIVADRKVQLPKWGKVKLILTGARNTGPAEKRDLALKNAKGEICAFIDDDAYPDPKWLKEAVKEFQNEKIAAVGGPGLTPPEDNYWEQLTGLVYQSYFCGGPTQHRFTKAKRRFVDDFPAYNLLVRTDILKKVGGYGSYFYGGEDTFLCLKLIRDGHKILYSPNVVVFHHRRALFLPYLKQIANVGKHRGYFAKRFPETSRTLGYFIPSVVSVGFLIALVLSIFIIPIKIAFLIGIIVAFTLGVISVIRFTDPLKASIVSVGIIFTHLTYGLNFINGLLIKDLTR